MAVKFRTGRNTKKYTLKILDMVQWVWKAMKMRDCSWDLIMKDRICL